MRLLMLCVRVVATLVVVCIGVLVGVTGSATHAATPSRNIRLDSQIYPFLERLAASELVKTYLAGTRPLSRNEVSLLLLEARQRLEDLEMQGIFPSQAIQRIVETIAEEITLRPGEEEAPYYFRALENPTLQFIYLEGEKSFIPGTGVQASQHSLVYNNEGIEPAEGGNGYLRFQAEGGVGPLLLYLQPLLSLEGDGVASAVLHQGYLKLGLKGLELEVGKDSLWWGQGYHGGLFLTNNAEPLRLVRLTNPHPVLLPWILRFLGPFRFDFFVSKLEEDRVVSEPIFTGLRFNFKPHPVLELGLTRTIVMFGEGRPGFTLGRLGEILFGDNKEADEDLSNSIAGIDGRLSLPFVQIYGEVGGEDEAGGFFKDRAYLVGLYLPNIGKNLNFRVEFADITNRAWYRHSVYRSGYTFEGRILGHHVGGGGRDLFFELGLLNGSRLDGKFNFDYEERGVNIQPVTEKHFQVGTEWGYRFGRTFLNWSSRIRFAYDRITNADFTADADRNNFLINLEVRGSW